LNKYKNNPFILDNHLRPQYEFIDENVEIFKFEDGIENILKHLGKKFNIRVPEKIDVKNRSKRDREVNFSLEALEKVNKFYHQDFLLFKYKKVGKELKIKNL